MGHSCLSQGMLGFLVAGVRPEPLGGQPECEALSWGRVAVMLL